jgi:hypothetical protein
MAAIARHDETLMTISVNPQNIDTPTITYTFNRITGIWDVRDAVADTLGDDIAKFEAVKINTAFHLILEHYSH